MDVLLDESEVTVAAYVGSLRQYYGSIKRLKDRHGYTGHGYDLHFGGAAGELAVAKALGLHWHLGGARFHKPDVGPYHVRTRYSHDQDLLVRDDDPADGIFVLVTTDYLGASKADRDRRNDRVFQSQTPALFRLRGWLYGHEAKDPRHRKNYGGKGAAYFVPSSALRPIATLPKPE
jgi:hypothetical protein